MPHGLRTLLHRVTTYPLLLPFILGYALTKDSRYEDMFYSIRSIVHGISMRNGLRMARYGGMRIVFPSREDSAFDDVWLRQVYYPYLPNCDDTVFDVGAHMGFFTLKIAKAVRRVIAFEPDPYSFRFLIANIEYNRLANVIAFSHAIGDKNRQAFLEAGYGHGRTRVTRDNTGREVHMKTVDAMAKYLGTPPNAIKIDVEGYELQVLRGARSTLNHHKPKLVIAAYHYPNESGRIAWYLSKLGFKCFVYRVPLVLQKTSETYIYAKRA